jgi:ATP-dependent Clp protease adaptor protein ClpS
MKIRFEAEYQELVEVEENVDLDENRNLVVFNDDFNTFDHVIDTLIKVCKHDVHQAEQCTFIIHYKGKCAVKNGSYPDLRPMRDAINERGIKASIT